MKLMNKLPRIVAVVRKGRRRDLIAAGRLVRRLGEAIRVDWVGAASCGVSVGRRAFVIDHTGAMHPDWWGTRRLALMAGAGA